MKLVRSWAISAAALAVLAGAAQAQTYTYVGSWYVGQGPYWYADPDNPPLVYSAREAAALLFGGVYTDYAISTLGADANAINFLAYVDGWGDHDYYPLVDQDFSYSPKDGRYWYGPEGLSGPYDPAYSAYVADAVDPTKVNYAFRASVVPEPATVLLLATGLLGLGVAARRRRREA